MLDFGTVSAAYGVHNRSLRGQVRHDLVSRQLDEHLAPGSLVLDVGCGDGQVTTRLAARGHAVIAVDPSETMLQRLRARLDALPREVAGQVELRRSTLEDLRPADVGPVDAVACHGVLMYLPDSRSAITSLARLLPTGGVLSVLTKNRDALAVQAGLRGDWTTARAVLAERRDRTLGNLGLTTRGDTLTDLRTAYDDAGLDLAAWFGVRVFSDHLDDEPLPPGRYEELIDLEELAARTSPYRELGRLLHLVGRLR